MLWQDVVFMIGGFIFSVSLIPTIRKGPPPQLNSSILTIIMLVAFGVAQFTLGLYLATVATAFTTAAWVILAIQKLRKG